MAADIAQRPRRSHPGITVRRARYVANPFNTDRASTVLAVTALWAIDPDIDVTQDWRVTDSLLAELQQRLGRQIRLRRYSTQHRRSPLVLGHVLTILVTKSRVADEHFADNEMAVLAGLRKLLGELRRSRGAAIDLDQLRKLTALIYVADHVLLAITNPIGYWRNWDPKQIPHQDLWQLCSAAVTA